MCVSVCVCVCVCCRRWLSMSLLRFYYFVICILSPVLFKRWWFVLISRRVTERSIFLFSFHCLHDDENQAGIVIIHIIVVGRPCQKQKLFWQKIIIHVTCRFDSFSIYINVKVQNVNRPKVRWWRINEFFYMNDVGY